MGNKSLPLDADRQKISKAPLFISILLLAILSGCYFLIPPFQNAIHDAYKVLTSENPERIREWVKQFGFSGPLMLVVMMVVQMFLFVIPNILVMMVAITCYGPFWGSVISLVGVFASSSFGYMIGRYLGRATVNRFIGVKTQERISNFIKDYGVPAIAITRLSSLSNDSLSFVTGMLRMSYVKYILATLGGITPLIVLLALYGRNGKIEKALILIAAVSIVLLVVYIVLDKRKKKRISDLNTSSHR
ncbi:TVP38/TMEM64 family protein [Pseudobacter ginsenosidimutans]|nr:VTT domain-containing protein [Pseudobacter ginsenosidimutans]QEC42037.1 TVP38/TMEM64 family protein [Pseudobacter ginsenosidimutans]